MAFHAGCSCVVVAALRFLSVDAAIEDRSIASIPAHKRFVLNGKGRLDVAIRQLPVGVELPRALLNFVKRSLL
jgi:hypothetical protein